jgi:hypothetical protein
VLAAALLGLPLRLMLSSTFCHIVPRREYLEAIRAQVHPGDVVFCDYPAFFEAKQVAPKVYSPMYSKHFVTLASHAHDFSPEEKQQITVLIIRPEHHAKLEPYFGGKWVGVSPPFGDSLEAASLARVPLVGSRLVHHFQAPQMARYQLQIFRRTRSTASVN